MDEGSTECIVKSSFPAAFIFVFVPLPVFFLVYRFSRNDSFYRDSSYLVKFLWNVKKPLRSFAFTLKFFFNLKHNRWQNFDFEKCNHCNNNANNNYNNARCLRIFSHGTRECASILRHTIHRTLTPLALFSFFSLALRSRALYSPTFPIIHCIVWVHYTCFFSRLFLRALFLPLGRSDGWRASVASGQGECDEARTKREEVRKEREPICPGETNPRVCSWCT